MDKLNLDAIPYAARWSIANALRSAAERYREHAATMHTLPGYERVATQFDDQAAAALAYAEQFEDC